ncbi:MAG: hypothetical protein DHS20C17_28250 [Cyclobacteriaceae bacterium]|nr:MAG: hypothetical protein DHS20C17_28250 [Cyclobacteriaceae bacterium]
MIFQTETPSELDLFEGKGHSNAAKAIRKVLEENEEVHIIGLEGELGSGKSTVIRLLHKNLNDDKYHFVIFDVEQYHHSSIKAAFIKVFSDDLKELCNQGSEKVIQFAKDKALGNILVYKKYTNSQLSWWVAFFAISVFFSVKYLSDGITSILATISGWRTGDYSPDLETTINSILGFSPLFVLLIMWIVRRFRKIPALGDLLKRNTKDTITEKLDITREVGSIEFKAAFKEFASVIPENKKIVLIIDNLDRVAHDKVREVWSDIEIITSLRRSNICILLPFSERHISEALKVADNGGQSGREFISKRLPVVFRAPPVVSAGWRKPFALYWSETLPDMEGEQATAELIDIWVLPRRQVTPRMLKKHVNDIACLVSSLSEFNIHPVCCSAYLLSLEHGIKINQLLSTETPQGENDIDGKHQSLTSTHKLLKKNFSDREWTNQITCIHYQTSPEVAQSELLGEPIRTAIKNYDAEVILELSNLFGFNLHFRKNADLVDPHELVKLAAKIEQSEGKSKDAWIKRWLPEINRLIRYDKSVPSEFDEEFIKAVRTLKEMNYEVELSRIKRAAKETENVIVKDTLEELESMNNHLSVLYSYSSITGIKPPLIEKPSAHHRNYDRLFVHGLWPNRDKFSSWKIEKIEFEIGEKKDILIVLSEGFEKDAKTPSLFSHFAKDHRLGIIEFSDPSKSPTATLDLSERDIQETDYSLYPYLSTWAFSDITNKLFEQLEKDDIDKSYKFQWTALTLAHLVATGDLNGTIKLKNPNGTFRSVAAVDEIKKYLDEDENYKTYLPDFLTFTPRFSTIIEQLKTEEGFRFLKESVRELIVNNRIYSLPLNSLIGQDYETIRRLFSESKRTILLDWLYRWENSVSIKFQNWNNRFVEDVFETGNNNWINKLLLVADEEREFTNEDLNSPSDNMYSTIAWLEGNNKKLKSSPQVATLLEQIIESKESSELGSFNKSMWFQSLMNCLNNHSKKKVIRHLENKLLQRGLSTEIKSAIIRNFGSSIKLPMVNASDDQNTLLILLEQCDDAVVIKWLDEQNWNIANWTKENLDALRSAVQAKSESYVVPNLRKNWTWNGSGKKEQSSVDGNQ